MGYKILAINPGSTSTKVALYDEERPLLELNLRHSTEEISRFAGVNDQLDWRRGLILSALREEAFDIRNLSAVIGRGGLIRPIPAGVYEVNSRMRYDLRNAQMKHACNLGGLLAAQNRPHGGCQGLHRRPAGGRRDGRRGTHLGHADVPAQTGLPRPEPEGHGASPLRTDGLGVRRIESDRGPHGRRHFGRRTQAGTYRRRQQRARRRRSFRPGPRREHPLERTDRRSASRDNIRKRSC